MLKSETFKAFKLVFFFSPQTFIYFVFCSHLFGCSTCFRPTRFWAFSRRSSFKPFSWFSKALSLQHCLCQQFDLREQTITIKHCHNVCLTNEYIFCYPRSPSKCFCHGSFVLVCLFLLFDLFSIRLRLKAMNSLEFQDIWQILESSMLCEKHQDKTAFEKAG